MSFRQLSHAALTFVIAALALCVVLPAAAITAEMAEDILPLNQVKPGMRGYGLTVFKGTQIEKFDVEIVGVLPKMNDGRPLILIRAGGGPITQRQTSIIAGMSGSPVYINGKLIGAVAYGISFSKEPIGMVTPIEDMMEALDPNLPTQPSGQSSEPELVALPQPLKVGGRAIENILFANRPDSRNAKPASSSTLMMVPLATPLMISGMSVRGIERISPLFERFNLAPMAGPGRLPKKVPASFQPGAAVGVALATGDIEIAFMGTLTYIKGDKILAFGHPILGFGPLNAALMTFYVHEILPSLLTSSKIGSPIEVVGKTTQDRSFSVSGQTGAAPDMIPVTVNVRDLGCKRSDRFNVSVINHPLLAPALIVGVVGEAIYRVRNVPGDAVAKVSFEIDADEVGTVKRDNVFFDRLSIDMTAVDELAELMFLLSRNRFYQVDVKHVNVNVEITSRRNTATIERIFVKESKYEPGDDMDVGVVLRPYKSDPVTRMMKVRIPPTLSSCKPTLMIYGGGGRGIAPVVVTKSDASDGAMPISESSIPSSTAENVNQLVDKFLEKEKNNELVAKLLLPDSAIMVSGEKLNSLPPVIAESFRNAKSTGLKQQREEVKTVEQTDWIIGGSQSLPIVVEKRNSSEKPAAPPSSESRPPSDMVPSSQQVTVVFDSGDDENDGEEYSAQTDLQQMDTSALVLQPPPGMTVIVAPAVGPSPPSAAAESTTDTAQPHPPLPPTDKKTTTEKSVARQITIWTQTTQKDFAGGEFEGSAAASSDDLRPVPKIARECEFNESFIWCILPNEDGSVTVGTGNSAVVYRVTKDGKPSMLADLPELEVHSLAHGKSGEIYAGTGPDGKVYKITPDGKADVIFDADEKYIVAVTSDSQGNVFAGTGDAPKIYRIDPNGKSQLFAELPGRYITTLVPGGVGSIYAGVGGSGVVYAIKQDGSRRAIYDAGDQAIGAIQPDGKGGLYIATATKGYVVKVDADGKAKPLYSKAGKSALGLGLWSVGAGNAAIVLYNDKACLVYDDETVMDVDNGERVQMTALAVSPSGDIYIGSSNSAALYAYHQSPPKATYESVAHDAKVQSTWGRIRWTADVPAGAKLAFQTRTGNTSEPDETWSAWSAFYAEPGQQILSTPARYIQYRAAFEGPDWLKSPVIKDVSVSFLTRNQAPALKIASPVGGDIWARKQTVKWSGSDPDGDTLTYQVFYSSDSGKTWQELAETKDGGKAKVTTSADDGEVKDEETATDGTVQDGKPADVTPGKSEKMERTPNSLEIPLAAAKPTPSRSVPKPKEEKADKKLEPAAASPGEPVPSPAPPKPPAKGPSKSTSRAWDTTKITDGHYTIKVIANDATSNAKDAQTKEAITEPVVVCNTPPTLVASERDLKVVDDKFATFTGSAGSSLVRITGVDYRVDGGDWMASEPVDGLFDSPFEEFRVATPEMTKGEHQLEIKAVDAAGNPATTKLKVKIGE